MRNIIYLLLTTQLLSFIPHATFAKVTPTIEPYASGTYGTFQFEDSYKGQYVAAGIGARVGLMLGPLFLGVAADGQFPAFLKDSGTTETQTDLDPLPGLKPWLSYGAAGGIRTRFFSVMYTYIFDSDLEARIRTSTSTGAMSKYMYHGTGQKFSALLHFNESFSLGAEMSNYKFDRYTLSSSTHVATKGSNASRKTLEMTGFSILFNYKIEVEVK